MKHKHAVARYLLTNGRGMVGVTVKDRIPEGSTEMQRAAFFTKDGFPLLAGESAQRFARTLGADFIVRVKAH